MPNTDTKEKLHEEGTLKKFRVQLDFTPADFDRINSLVKDLGLGTRAELFREAILTLEWMIAKKKQGEVVTATSKEGRCVEPQFGVLRNVTVESMRVDSSLGSERGLFERVGSNRVRSVTPIISH